MNFNEYHKQLAAAPLSFRRKLRDYLRRPTERNACYIAGYVAALVDARLFKTEDAANYWSAVIGRTERMPDVGEKLIAEMDSPPVGGTQAAALEAGREERDALLDALRQIAEWPDGGNRYGQENIKRFAQTAIDAAIAKAEQIADFRAMLAAHHAMPGESCALVDWWEVKP